MSKNKVEAVWSHTSMESLTDSFLDRNIPLLFAEQNPHPMLANGRLSKDKLDSRWTSLESVSDSFRDGDKPPSASWTGFSSNAEDFKDQGGSCMVSYFDRTSI